MSYLLLQADAGRIPLPDKSVDLVFGSPPYLSQRTYLEAGRNLGIARGLDAWIEWMLVVTTEALRVSKGAVIWIAAGCTKDRNYQPACEGLMYLWFKRGGECHQYRPCYWHRVGIPGSGGDQWFRADVEYVMAFKRPGLLPWAKPLAVGKPPKFRPGGAMSHQTLSGRVNGWTRNADGSKNVIHYSPPAIANPGTLVECKVGGGHMGSDLSRENEGPFPESLASHFVRSMCPEGGIVLDPFSGSGTTAAVALATGRHGIGCDLRRSQAELGERRIAEAIRPRSRLDAAPAREPLNGQLSFLDALGAELWT